jgi:hypothetical protein
MNKITIFYLKQYMLWLKKLERLFPLSVSVSFYFPVDLPVVSLPPGPSEATPVCSPHYQIKLHFKRHVKISTHFTVK